MDGTVVDVETIPLVVDGKDGAQGPQGVPGPAGADGKTLYTWIKYADDAQGGGISNNPTGKAYIGFAYNKETATESNNPSDYTWSDIKEKTVYRVLPVPTERLITHGLPIRTMRTERACTNSLKTRLNISV